MLLIYNVRIGGTVPEGAAPVIEKGYLVASGDTITEVGEGEAPAALLAREDVTAVDGAGRLLMPGVIDTHVHFRDPGLTHKGSIASESAAAVAGGVTSYIDMPNTNPATISLQAWEEKMARAAEVSLANYAFFLGATSTNLDDTLLRADYSRVPGVKLFLGSSTGGMLVDDGAVIRRIMAEVPALIAVHAEDEDTIRRNRDALIARYGRELPIAAHPVIRDHDACFEATRRAIGLARETGARLHICHISTSDELRLLTPGPVKGKQITSETCPHYLIFTDEHYPSLGSRIKCNPAIKRPTDRDDILFALTHDVIDTLATDHAPHLLSEKEGSALTAASGMPSVQWALTVMLQAALEGWISIPKVIEKMTISPALVYGIERRGALVPGYKADLTLIDTAAEPRRITDSLCIGPAGWTPYDGLETSVRVDATWVNGQMVYSGGVARHIPSAPSALSFCR
ncbi:MAG: amidohydrolase family protein [Pseudoflavonifractor sp.]|nr:amidohydrolase family protein [Alloprevotella sp.]MCM1117672.1 amidohydrolase family protein [Pseudoflavonifractor sp.]